MPELPETVELLSASVPAFSIPPPLPLNWLFSTVTFEMLAVTPELIRKTSTALLPLIARFASPVIVTLWLMGNVLFQDDGVPLRLLAKLIESPFLRW